MIIKWKSLIVRLLNGAEFEVELPSLDVKALTLLEMLNNEGIFDIYMNQGFGCFCHKCFIRKNCSRKSTVYSIGILDNCGRFVDLSMTILDLQKSGMLSNKIYAVNRSHYCRLQYSYFLASSSTNPNALEDYSKLLITVDGTYEFEYVLNLKLTSPKILIDNLYKYGIIPHIELVRNNLDNNNIIYILLNENNIQIPMDSGISFNNLGIKSGDKFYIKQDIVELNNSHESLNLILKTQDGKEYELNCSCDACIGEILQPLVSQKIVNPLSDSKFHSVLDRHGIPIDPFNCNYPISYYEFKNGDTLYLTTVELKSNI